MNVELVDFKDVDRKPARPHLQDPGATRLILFVRDVEALLPRLKAQNVPVITVGGSPVSLDLDGTKARGIVVSDPDGFSIELRQLDPLPASAATATGEILGARVGLTVENMEQSLKVYRDLLKLQVLKDTPFKADRAFGSMANVSGGELRRVTLGVPGSTLTWELVEFRGVDRKPIGSRIQDPGSTRVQLRVRDSAETIAALKGAGGTLVTTGTDGGPINMNGLRLGIVRDPNNLFLVIFQPGAPRG